MKHVLYAAAAGLLLSPFAAQAQPAQALGETNPLAVLAGNRFEGLWWAESVPGASPIILTVGRLGDIELNTAVDAGGHLPFELSEMRGVWRRSGPREATVVLLRFLYNLDGTIRAVVRGHGVMRFGQDFNTLEVTVQNDQFACESVPNPPGAPPGTSPSCPDILTAPFDATRAAAVVARRVPVPTGE